MDNDTSEGQSHDAFTEFIHTLQRIVAVTVEYTWYLIREIFKILLDIICFALMVASCVSPTRTIFAPYAYFYILFVPLRKQREVYYYANPTEMELEKMGIYKKLNVHRARARYVGLYSFLYAIFDIILIGLAVIVLCIPTRTFPFLKEMRLCRRGWFEHINPHLYHVEYRLTVVRNFGRAILDLFGIILFILSIMLTPWFAIAYLRSAFPIFFVYNHSYYGAEINGRKGYAKFQLKRILHFCRMGFSFAMNSIFDTLIALPCFIISLIAPHRFLFILMDTLKAIYYINSAQCQHLTPTNDRSYDYELHNNEENESVEMQNSRIKFRFICLFNSIASVIDIVAIPLGVVGLICGVHGIELIREIINAFRSGKNSRGENNNKQHALLFFSKDFVDGTTYVHTSYNFNARKAAIAFGIFSIIDLISLPFLIITVLCVIRVRILYNHYSRIRRKRDLSLTDEIPASIPTQLAIGNDHMDDKGEGFLPRLNNANDSGNNFGEAMPNEFAVDTTNGEETMYYEYLFEKYYMYELREQIIRQGFLTLIDFIFVPAILIIFVTYYRFQNISKEMKHNFGWKTKRLVLENLILVICDIIFLPLFVIVLISCYRYRLFTDLVNKQGEQKFDCKHSFQRYLFLLSSILLIICDIIMLPLQMLLVLTLWRRTPIIQSFADHSFNFEDSMERYTTTIIHVFLFAFDVITLPFSVILLLSVYRTVPVFHLYFAKNEVNYLGCRKSFNRFCQVYKHFSFFIIDLLLLPLMLIIIISFYRIPELKMNATNLYSYLKEFFNAQKALVVMPTVHSVIEIEAGHGSGDNSLPNNVVAVTEAKIVDAHDILDVNMVNNGGHMEDNVQQQNTMNLSFVAPSKFYFTNSINRIRVVLATFLLIILDVIVLPLTLVVYIFQHRWVYIKKLIIPPTQTENNIDNENRNDGMKSYIVYHQEVAKQFFLCITDVLVGIIALTVIITVFRADVIFQILGKRNEAIASKKKQIMIQFLKVIRDAAVMPFFFIIVLTLYRLPSCILNFISSASQPITEPGILKITKLIMHIPLNKGPISFYFYGTSSNLNAINQLEATGLRILGKNKFWANVEGIFGGLAVQVGKGTQPLKVTSNIILPGEVKNDLPLDLVAEMPVGQEILILVKTKNKVKLKSVNKHLGHLIKKTGNTTSSANTTVSAEDIQDMLDIMLQVEGVSEHQNKQNVNMCNVKLSLRELHSNISTSVIQSTDMSYHINVAENDTTEDKLLPYWSKGPGFRDSMWHIVLLTSFNIAVDLLYLICLIISLATPWRFFHALWLMNLSSKRYDVEETKYLLQTLYDIDMALQKHIEIIYDFINESGKCNYTKQHWFKNIDSKLRQRAQITLNEFDNKLSLLMKDLNEKNTYVHDATFKMLCKKFEKQAIRKSQLPVIHANVNLSMQQMLFSNEYEGLMMLEFNNAERINAKYNLQETLIQLQRRYAQLLHNANNPSPEDHGSDYKYGFWRRKEKVLRQICFKSLKYAIMDILTFALLVLVFVTVYRFPKFISRVSKESKRGGISSPRVRRALRIELELMCYDVINLIYFIVLFAMVTITLIRLPRLIGDIPSFESLPEAVEVAKMHLERSLAELWTLFSLLFIWETYVVIVRVLFYAILVPAASFATLLHLLFRKVFGSNLRFLISGGLWLTCLIVPVITLQANNFVIAESNTRINMFIAIISIVSGIICFNLCYHFTNKERQKFSDQTWRSPIVRLTLPNIFSLMHIFFTPFQMLLAFALLITKNTAGTTTYGYFPKMFVTTFLFLSNSRNVLEDGSFQSQGLFIYDDQMVFPPTGTIIALFFIIAWIYLVTAPLAIQDHEKRKRVQESAAYRNFSSILHEFFYITICANLFQPMMPNYDMIKKQDSSNNRTVNITNKTSISNSSIPYATSSKPVHTGKIPAKDLLTCATIGIIYFIFTTLAESTRSRGATKAVRPETTDVGHDIQYTELYNLVSRFLSTLFVLLCLIFHNGSDDEVHLVAISVIVICCLMAFWNVLYRQLFNFNPSSIPWIIPLHFGSILIVASGCIFMLFDKRLANNDQINNNVNFMLWLLSSIIIFLIVVLVALKLRYDATEERKQFKLKSGLIKSLNHLFALETRLVLDDDLSTFKSKNKSKSRKYLKNINTPIFLAKAVINLEKKILCENYHPAFIRENLLSHTKLELWRTSLQRPEIDFPRISQHIVELSKHLRPPHYTQLIRKIIEEKFHSHNMYNYTGLVMSSILGFLYGGNTYQYEQIQRKYYKYLNENRTKDFNGDVRLIPRKVIFPISYYQPWMKAFDERAKMYWSDQEKKRLEKVEQGRSKNLVSSILGAMGEFVNAGRNIFMDKKLITYVMTKHEFCNLPGALITHPSQNDKNPHYLNAFILYQSIIRITLSLKKFGTLRTDAAEVQRCSIKFLFDQVREHYAEHNFCLPDHEIKSNIQAGLYHSKSHLAQVSGGAFDVVDNTFNQVDSMKRGKIDKKQLCDALINMGESVEPHEIFAYFHQFDDKETGFIDIIDFREIMKLRWKKSNMIMSSAEVDTIRSV